MDDPIRVSVFFNDHLDQCLPLLSAVAENQDHCLLGMMGEARAATVAFVAQVTKEARPTSSARRTHRDLR